MLHPIIIIEDFRTTQISGSCNSASSCATADYFCFQMIDCHLFSPSFQGTPCNGAPFRFVGYVETAYPCFCFFLQKRKGCREQRHPLCDKAAGGRFSQAVSCFHNGNNCFDDEAKLQADCVDDDHTLKRVWHCPKAPAGAASASQSARLPKAIPPPLRGGE